MAESVQTINLEAGLPTGEVAVKRMMQAIYSARAGGVKALKFIHGYGSSGSGGRLRVALRDHLRNLSRTGLYHAFIEGEHFEIFDETTRSALASIPSLSRDRDLGRHNNGITIVIL